MAHHDLILETNSLTKSFNGFTAVNGVDLRVRRGTIHALIGPNGAGKTTCFNLLTKFLTPTSGQGDHPLGAGVDCPPRGDSIVSDIRGLSASESGGERVYRLATLARRVVPFLDERRGSGPAEETRVGVA
jgi:energy-coupling factor transporter ATP-binding protein EcfA2